MMTVKARVSGRVQGVWFRQSTKEKAVSLGLTGWANNLPDGEVEVLLSGDEAAVKEVLDWLHQGPPLARVDKVEARQTEFQQLEGFTTGWY